MAEQLSQIGAPFELHYSTRTPSSGAYVDELKQRYGRKLHHYQTVSNRRINLENLLGHQPLGTHLYVCGPDAMIEMCSGPSGKQAGRTSICMPNTLPPRAAALRSTSSWRNRPKPYASMRTRAFCKPLNPLALSRRISAAAAHADSAKPGHACDGSILHYDHYLTNEEKQAGRKIMICVSRIKGATSTLDL